MRAGPRCSRPSGRIRRAASPSRRRAAATTPDIAWQAGDWLVFGSETAGLPADLREAFPAAQRVRLPMRTGQRSLNLSNAVAVAVFEAWRQCGWSGAS